MDPDQLVWLQLGIILGFPFIGIGLGVLSTFEVLGKAWHRPHLYTRALGAVGLLATIWIGVQWSIVTFFFAAEMFYAVAYVS